ncbi:MAG: hypothetical protein IJK96_00040 [Bacteroidales bacterium]|nr:hypothetical protein [Bacteroidales bacterium]
MEGKISPLWSEYVIDGSVPLLPPGQMLQECLAADADAPDKPEGPFEPVVDEVVDPAPSSNSYDPSLTMDYLSRTTRMRKSRRPFQMFFPGPFTRSRIAAALIDTLWLRGHFRLQDIRLGAEWKWNPAALGNMAVFWNSAEAAADYIDSLGLSLSGFSYSETSEACRVGFNAFLGGSGIPGQTGIDILPDDDEDEDLSEDLPGVWMGRGRRCPSKFVPDPESWIVYIPFDSCDYRLGGSLLAESFGTAGSVFPEIRDADYFVDCFEVVRELVEDKVILSGATVGDGGLLTALNSMCGGRTGARIDVGDVMRASNEKGIVRVLFGEVPGVIIQIRDIDYDYIDAELLLQDVVWFPLGHPNARGSLEICNNSSSGIAGIIQSLMSSQAPEGED